MNYKKITYENIPENLLTICCMLDSTLKDEFSS